MTGKPSGWRTVGKERGACVPLSCLETSWVFHCLPTEICADASPHLAFKALPNLALIYPPSYSPFCSFFKVLCAPNIPAVYAFPRYDTSTSLLRQFLLPGISSPFPLLRTSALIMSLLISSTRCSFPWDPYSLLNFLVVHIILLSKRVKASCISLTRWRASEGQVPCLIHLGFPHCAQYLALVGHQ